MIEYSNDCSSLSANGFDRREFVHRAQKFSIPFILWSFDNAQLAEINNVMRTPVVSSLLLYSYPYVA